MILFGSSMSPFVPKVLAYASEKGIELESRSVGIGDPDPQFRAASPFGKMPALVDGDFALSDSSAIIHYLEALHPEPPMIPNDARERGRVIWFEEFADTILMGCGSKMFFNRVVAPLFMKREGNLQIAASAEQEELPAILAYLERVIPADGFLVGDRLTLADLAVASPLANFAHMDVEIDGERFPRTKAFSERVLSRPSFAPLIARERAFLERAKS